MRARKVKQSWPMIPIRRECLHCHRDFQVGTGYLGHFSGREEYCSHDCMADAWVSITRKARL